MLCDQLSSAHALCYNYTALWLHIYIYCLAPNFQVLNFHAQWNNLTKIRIFVNSANIFEPIRLRVLLKGCYVRFCEVVISNYTMNMILITIMQTAGCYAIGYGPPQVDHDTRIQFSTGCDILKISIRAIWVDDASL